MFWWGGGLFILLVFLFVSQYFGNANHTNSASVPCLIRNFPLVQHIHPIISITVDGNLSQYPRR